MGGDDIALSLLISSCRRRLTRGTLIVYRLPPINTPLAMPPPKRRAAIMPAEYSLMHSDTMPFRYRRIRFRPLYNSIILLCHYIRHRSIIIAFIARRRRLPMPSRDCRIAEYLFCKCRSPFVARRYSMAFILTGAHFHCLGRPARRVIILIDA